MKALAPAFISLSLTAALAGCSNSSSPDGLPSGDPASLSASVMATNLGGTDSIPYISCDVTLHVAFSGDTAQKFTWNQGVFRFYYGKNGNTPVDTQVVPQADITQAWQGPPTITPDRQSNWRFHGGYPFTVEIEFHYQFSAVSQAQGAPAGDRLIRTSLRCGPSFPSSLAAPVISSVTVTPPTDVKYGDSITVTYTATNGTGIWASAISLCGFTRVFFDRGVPSVHRAVAIPVIPDCQPNAPLNPGVTAADVAAQVSATTGSGPPVIDQTRPTLSGGILRGTVWVGDTVYPGVSFSDDGLVSAVVWTVPGGGARDSILLNQHSGIANKELVIPPSWAGKDSLLIFARDAAGLVSDTVGVGPSVLAIRPTVVHPLVTGRVNALAFSLISDPKRGAIYVMDRYGRQVAIASATTGNQTGTVHFPAFPWDMDLTASGDSLAVAVGGGIAFVNLDAPSSPYSVLPLPMRDSSNGEIPFTLRVSRSGRLFTGLSHPYDYTSQWRLGEVELASGNQRILGAGDTYGGSLIARSANRQVLVLNGPHLQRYIDSTDTFGALQATPGGDDVPAVSPDGNYAALYGRILGPALDTVLSVSGFPSSETFSSDGQFIYMLDGRYVYKRHVPDGTAIERFTTPSPGAIWAGSGNALVTTQAIGSAYSNVAIVNLAQLAAVPPPRTPISKARPVVESARGAGRRGSPLDPSRLQTMRGELIPSLESGQAGKLKSDR